MPKRHVKTSSPSLRSAVEELDRVSADQQRGDPAPHYFDPVHLHGEEFTRVRRATFADVLYVTSLARRDTEALGFIPRGAVEEKVGLGRFWMVEENGDPAGFVYHGSLSQPDVRIFQAAVQYDARRRGSGLVLIERVIARASVAGALSVSLRCREGLEANDFWRAAGFQIVGTAVGGERRGDMINIWRRRLPAKSLYPLACTEDFRA